ncbi:MAG: lipopolysaccharide biosynthesis protein RfbH [Flavobacteriaceae bacterium]|nr:lipopolysaccharide biosynthesis protein RfbH [Flavobacteriaceae bacterium]|tara:strand:- start:5391 stop:6692 length:1302 start_codon:yes stop_codon:yes gene_type:complete
MDKNSLIKEIIELSNKYFEDFNSESPFIPNISSIPVSGKVLDKEDLEYLIRSSLDLWLTSGDFTDEFEKKLRNVTGHRHALFVNSGSSANLLALTSLKILHNIDDGAEVITSAVNFPTTLNPILQNNLTPVLVDAEKGTFNIDADLIESQISEKTKGIVLAHTLGNPIDLDKITKLADKYDLFLMEDMCDAFGSTYKGKNVGTFGDVATLSFYPAHHITTGEGGAVLTSNTKLKKIIESLRDWGRDCYCPPGKDNTCKKRFDWQLGNLPPGYDHKYIYSHIGYNLKATDMQAAIGISQLNKLESFIKTRRENFSYLYNEFKNFKEFDLPVWYKDTNPSWFGFPLMLNDNAKFTREDLLRFYQERKIGTRLIFAGNITKQPAYINSNISENKEFPIADQIMNNAFWLGVYPGLNLEMLDFIIDETKIFLNNKKR